MSPSRIPYRRAQSGAALLVALVMLLIITLIGVSAARTQTLQVRMAANVHNRHIALQAAEGALRWAEGNLLQAVYTSFESNANGLYNVDQNVATPYYKTVTWSSSSTSVISYTGPSLPSDNYAQAPLFIVERLPKVVGTGYSISVDQSGSVPSLDVFRVTAQATGGDGTATVTLQSVFH
ncbi:MAG: hypothetical protein ISP90_06280 [Nevskia sp.]|nr:hypothetical protein [Nevskia sp.]